jgi:hypothetical protein
MTNVTFMPLPIVGLIGCCVPVVPGTIDTDGPMSERIELCAIDANWMVGAVPTCDLHVRHVCELCEIDWPELVAETGRDQSHADRPREERERHPQVEVEGHKAHFMGRPS